MKKNSETEPHGNEPQDVSRRNFLNQTAAIAGLAGVGLAVGLSGCKQEQSNVPANQAAPTDTVHTASNVHMQPGQLDAYYGLWSGGHTGDVRVLGLPSGREIHRILCFVPDALVGWGITNESKDVMGAQSNGELTYRVGDTHHVHASYRDGNYDGRYAWVNDSLPTA